MRKIVVSICFYKLIVTLVWIEHDTWKDAYTVYPNRGVEVEYESGRTATKQLSVSRKYCERMNVGDPRRPEK